MSKDTVKHHRIFISENERGFRWNWWLYNTSPDFKMKRIARFVDDSMTISVYTYPNLTVPFGFVREAAHIAKQALKGK